MSFAPDGGGQGYLKGADSPEEHTTAAFDYATDSELELGVFHKKRQQFLVFMSLRKSSLLVGRRYLCSIFHCSAR
jgi:hypothetical protein